MTFVAMLDQHCLCSFRKVSKFENAASGLFILLRIILLTCRIRVMVLRVAPLHPEQHKHHIVSINDLLIRQSILTDVMEDLLLKSGFVFLHCKLNEQVHIYIRLG
jgi:hypothetical protein